jgi:hypothetical protein
MHMSKVIRFNRSRRKLRLQASVVSADTEATIKIDCHVAKMPRDASGAMEDHTVNHRGPANACAQGQDHDITAPATRAPQHFGNQSNSRIIVGVKRHVNTNHIGQQATLKKVQVGREPNNTRRFRIDDAFAADTDTAQRPFRPVQSRMHKFSKRGRSSGRWRLKALDQITIEIYDRSLDRCPIGTSGLLVSGMVTAHYRQPINFQSFGILRSQAMSSNELRRQPDGNEAGGRRSFGRTTECCTRVF